MKKRQSENTAKFLYDISKIVFTLAVLGNIIAKNEFNAVVFFLGIFGAILTFLWAFALDGREDI